MKADVYGALPAEAAAAWPDQSAVHFKGLDITFSQLDKAIDVAARGLMALGVEAGDKVALLITNRPEFIVALFATFKVGAVAVPLNTRYRENDLAFVLGFSESKVLITVDRSGPVDYLSIVSAALPEVTAGKTGKTFDKFPHLEHVVVVGGLPPAGALSWSQLNGKAAAISPEQLARRAESVKPTDTALIIFTSGTTGTPKGVMHNHSALRACRDRAVLWGLKPGDCTIAYLPMFHVYGLGEIIFAAMVAGMRQIVMDTFDPHEALALIGEHKVEIIHGFDTHYADLMKALDQKPYDITSLRFGTFPSGSEGSIPIARAAQKRLCPTVTGSGMSEAWGWVTSGSLTDTEEQRCDTSGRAMPGIECRIVDPATGVPVPDGTTGEIVYRGYSIMQGYMRDPEATARTIDADGWLHSGDQGVMYPGGFVRFMGRYKEMLRVGGENVSPVGVENELMTLVPAIDQVAVVPYPDERLNEVVVAYVTAKPGAKLVPDEVMAACRGKIASFKIPRHVLLVDQLPMTASGKVQRTLLRQRALADVPQSQEHRADR